MAIKLPSRKFLTHALAVLVGAVATAVGASAPIVPAIVDAIGKLVMGQ